MMHARPEMLRMGRTLRGLTQRELAEATSIDQALISKYENGRPIPDGDLITVAKALRLPENFFFRQMVLHAPNGASMMMFRRRQTATEKTQEQVLMEINRLGDNIRVLLESVDVQGMSSLPFHEPTSESLDEIEDIAERVRLELRVAPGPIPSMTRILESVGVVILQRPLPPKVDALVDSLPGSAPIMLLSNELLGGRQRFTEAHELGHLVMHNALSFSYEALEAQANRFASAFLMPKREIKAKLRDLTMERLTALSAEWRVSVQALVRRGLDLDVLNYRQYRTWNETLGKSGYRTAEPIAIPTEKPTLLKLLIQTHLNELRYPVNELADALAMEEWEFRSIYLDEPLHLVKKEKKTILRPFADGG